MTIPKKLALLAAPQVIRGWLFLVGITIPISVAAQNIVAFTGGALILGLLTASGRLKFSPIDYVLAIGIAAFYLIEWLHDGAASRIGGLLLIFFAFLKIGGWLRSQDNQWSAPLMWGLITGIGIGFGIDFYRRPDYPLWATTGAKYANEASFIALTAIFLTLLRNWKLAVALAVPLLVFVVMTGARSTMLALVIGLSLYLFLRLRKRHAVMGTVICTALAGMLFFLPASNSILSRITFNIDQARLALWQHGWEIARNDHFLGRGEKQFTVREFEALRKQYPEAQGYWRKVLDRPMPAQGIIHISFHNQLVQLLVEHGLAGAILYGLFLLAPLILYFPRRSGLDEANMTGIGLWLAFVVHNMFELGLYNASAILMGLTAGMFGILTQPPGSGK